MTRATAVLRAGSTPVAPYDTITLAHDERRLRRKLLRLAGGDEVMVDLAETVTLADGDSLVLDDGRHAGVRAAPEALLRVTARDGRHLAELAWHLGNRHLPVAIAEDALLVARDDVIRNMLIGLGGSLEEVTGPFSPVHGAYHDHGHALLKR